MGNGVGGAKRGAKNVSGFGKQTSNECSSHDRARSVQAVTEQ